MSPPAPTGLSALARMLPPPPGDEPPPAPARPGGALAGATWDDFAIGEPLGAGAMGEVYRATQLSLQRAVALKVLPAGDGEAARRVAVEARTAAAIDSPHVVRVFAWGEHPPWLYIAFELMEGGSLAAALAARRAAGRAWPPAEAVELALQAARGLAAAHAHGLVHRDVKPGNLMLAADGALKVADFGLVKVLDAAPLTATGSSVGTPLYMSPEQCRGAAVDARSDLYALGCVLYELLALRPPFAGDSPEALAFQHNYAEPGPLRALAPDTPPALEALVLTCLQKDPARRYADAARLVADLERLRGGLAPLSALFDASLGTGAEEALRRAAPRRRWWPLLAGAAALAAALAGGWWWWDARKLAERQLRERLAPLSAAAPAPATAGADLDRLARLAGGDDPQVRQGRARLVELAALEAELERLAAAPEPPAARAAAAAALDRLAACAGQGHPLLAPWRARLDALAGEEAALRRELAALDREAPAAALRAAAEPRLRRLALLAGEDDEAVRRWRAALAAGAAEEERLRARLARLDDPAPLTAAAVDELDAAHARLSALALPGGVPPAWAARLAGDRRQREALQRRLAEALAAPGDDRAATAAAEEAAARLAALQALDPAEAGRVAARAEAHRQAERATAAQRAALAARLADLDLPRTPAAEAGRDLAAYEALAGPDDGDARRWRARLARVRTLQARLAPLAQPGEPPPGAAADLAALAELCGSDDPQAVAAGARLAAIAAARAWLGDALDRPAPIPPEAPARLAAAAALLGDGHDQVRRWRAKLAEWEAAAAALERAAASTVLDPAALAEAERALAAAAALAGEEAAAPWRTAIAGLRGPPPPAWAAAHGRDRHGAWIEAAPGGARVLLRWIPPGRSWLGSPDDEAGRGDDEYLVRTRLGRGRWCAAREVDQRLWRAVMGDAPARRRGDDLPVEQVSRGDAERFCARLGALLPGCRARLPGEAEWEAAARGGDAGPWGGLPAHQAANALVWQDGHRYGPEPCGGRAANAFGLEDCLGNVWEWVAGGYGPHPVGAEAVDPAPPAGDGRGVARGGSWADPLAACRAANRVAVRPDLRSPQLGFRFVVDADEGGAR